MASFIRVTTPSSGGGSVTYGTTAGTAAQGNDSRIVNAVQNARQVLAGSGLSGGGDLSADRTLALALTKALITATGLSAADISALGLQEVVNLQSSVSGTYAVPDVTTATIHRLTLTGATTLTFPSLPSSGSSKTFTVVAVQDGTGGRTLAFPTVKWPNNVSPTVSSGASKTDVYTFASFDATNWLGWTAGQLMGG